jgi:hypothetical protein
LRQNPALRQNPSDVPTVEVLLAALRQRVHATLAVHKAMQTCPCCIM